MENGEVLAMEGHSHRGRTAFLLFLSQNGICFTSAQKNLKIIIIKKNSVVSWHEVAIILHIVVNHLEYRLLK